MIEQVYVSSHVISYFQCVTEAALNSVNSHVLLHVTLGGHSERSSVAMQLLNTCLESIRSIWELRLYFASENC
jgi:isoprenylcysteine carboxyl methyltransferase (ICMT) family protein YpbQ